MAQPCVWPSLYKQDRPQPEPNPRRKAPHNNEHRNQCPNEQNGTGENRKGTQVVKRAGITAVPTPTWPNMGEQQRYPNVEEWDSKGEYRKQENTDVLTRNLRHFLPPSRSLCRTLQRG